MPNSATWFYIKLFLLYVGSQVLFLLNIELWGLVYPFVYVGFLLFLPLHIRGIPYLLLAFAVGLGVDVFYDSLGIHAAASVLVAALRPLLVNLLTPTGGYPDEALPSASQLGLGWLASYLAPLVFAHHAVVFSLDHVELSLLLSALWKTLASSLFTFIMLLLLQSLIRTRSMRGSEL